MQGVFEQNFAIKAPASEHIPVFHHTSGCPPSPRVYYGGVGRVFEEDIKEDIFDISYL